MPASMWPRYIAWARVALAFGALALTFVFPVADPWVFRSALAAFLAFAALLAIRGRKPGLVALAADLLLFLALGSLGPPQLIWIVSAFFLFLLTETLVFHTSLELTAIAAICAICGALLPFPPLRALEPTILMAGILACGFAFSRQRQQRAAEALNRQIAEAQKASDKARDDERQRIASDFHDGPLQTFISLQMRLEILRKVMERDFDVGMDDLKELQQLAQTQVRDLRTFLHSMRPVDVDGANFVATARRMAESFQKESGIPVTFLGTNAPVGLPAETTTEALQMLRESLVNVQKHAGASRVAVTLEKSEKGLEISVDDNGHGFPFSGNYTLDELELLRLGPASLKRRARSLNAELSLESRPGRGAGLKFRIPLQ